MRVAPAQSREQWGHQATKRDKRIAAERTEEQVEPNYIRFVLPHALQEIKNGLRIVERPAAYDVKAFWFGVTLW
ncbi:MAG TPA: hypothetical protein VGS27_27445 [Candidatus Sulfotelmatobacter sp.]|nr:hypothetical protein [Candidatus Sulfotelmatobacter sp.]